MVIVYLQRQSSRQCHSLADSFWKPPWVPVSRNYASSASSWKLTRHAILKELRTSSKVSNCYQSGVTSFGPISTTCAITVPRMWHSLALFWYLPVISTSICSELRRLFQSIRELVERRFGADYESSNLKWQCVSAFCFLRLIVPAILHPHLWGLHPGTHPNFFFF